MAADKVYYRRSSSCAIVVGMRTVWIVLLAVVAGTSAAAQQRIMCSGPNDPTCPAECRKDLSHHYGIIQTSKLPAGTEGMYYGPTVHPLLTKPTILISSNVPARYLAATKHHEACHAEMAIVTGSHVYHP